MITLDVEAQCGVCSVSIEALTDLLTLIVFQLGFYGFLFPGYSYIL